MLVGQMRPEESPAEAQKKLDRHFHSGEVTQMVSII
jgi:hypothetical protein